MTAFGGVKNNFLALINMVYLLLPLIFRGKCSTLQGCGVQTTWPTQTHGGYHLKDNIHIFYLAPISLKLNHWWIYNDFLKRRTHLARPSNEHWYPVYKLSLSEPSSNIKVVLVPFWHTMSCAGVYGIFHFSFYIRWRAISILEMGALIATQISIFIWNSGVREL